MTEELAWIAARVEILEAPVTERGSVFELREVQDVLVSAEQAFRVLRKHGVSLDDTVLVETRSDGSTVNHWRAVV